MGRPIAKEIDEHYEVCPLAEAKREAFSWAATPLQWSLEPSPGLYRRYRILHFRTWPRGGAKPQTAQTKRKQGRSNIRMSQDLAAQRQIVTG